ncbi:uncharacterized protein LOC120340104 [Styela clava]
MADQDQPQEGANVVNIQDAQINELHAANVNRLHAQADIVQVGDIQQAHAEFIHAENVQNLHVHYDNDALHPPAAPQLQVQADEASPRTMQEEMPSTSDETTRAQRMKGSTDAKLASDDFPCPVYEVAPIPSIPGEIQNLRSKQDGNSILFEWDPLDIPPDKYKIQWRVGDENIIEEYTKNPKFEKRYLKPAEFYSLRLMAINSSGRGEMTDWETFITNPLPPRNFRVRPNEKNKTTSLIVTFDDDFHLLKKYRVEASCRSPLINDDRSEITDKHFHIFNDLKPGQIYDTKVQTIFCDEKMSQFIP